MAGYNDLFDFTRFADGHSHGLKLASKIGLVGTFM